MRFRCSILALAVASMIPGLAQAGGGPYDRQALLKTHQATNALPKKQPNNNLIVVSTGRHGGVRLMTSVELNNWMMAKRNGKEKLSPPGKRYDGDGTAYSGGAIDLSW